MQFATQRWTPEQLAEHRRTATKLGQIVNEAFGYTGANLKDGPTEFQVAQFIRQRFSEEGLGATDGPIVATNAHASDPHYEPAAEGSSVIQRGDWLLIDLWAKPAAEDSVYADITWVAYVGESVPELQQVIFNIVIGARDAALKYLEDAHQQGLPSRVGKRTTWPAAYHRRPGIRRIFHSPLGAQHRSRSSRRCG